MEVVQKFGKTIEKFEKKIEALELLGFLTCPYGPKEEVIELSMQFSSLLSTTMKNMKTEEKDYKETMSTFRETLGLLTQIQIDAFESQTGAENEQNTSDKKDDQKPIAKTMEVKVELLNSLNSSLSKVSDYVPPRPSKELIEQLKEKSKKKQVDQNASSSTTVVPTQKGTVTFVKNSKQTVKQNAWGAPNTKPEILSSKTVSSSSNQPQDNGEWKNVETRQLHKTQKTGIYVNGFIWLTHETEPVPSIFETCNPLNDAVLKEIVDNHCDFHAYSVFSQKIHKTGKTVIFWRRSKRLSDYQFIIYCKVTNEVIDIALKVLKRHNVKLNAEQAFYNNRIKYGDYDALFKLLELFSLDMIREFVKLELEREKKENVSPTIILKLGVPRSPDFVFKEEFNCSADQNYVDRDARFNWLEDHLRYSTPDIIKIIKRLTGQMPKWPNGSYIEDYVN
jgi:hypothetical protein